VTHLPLHRPPDADAAAPNLQRLLGHLARGNPQWQHLQSQPRAVVTFLGPHAYMSPSVYADLERVPTWNYIALHATVQITLVHAEDDKDRLLKCLIGDHEPAYADQWRALAETYTTRMLSAIVGLEMDVIEWQCAAKVNQHRPEARDAMLAAYRAGTDHERALAQWIERLPSAGA